MGDRADADGGGHAVADAFEEVRRDPDGTFLAVGAVALHWDEAVRDVPDQGGRSTGMYGAQVHGEGVGESLAFGGQARITEGRVVRRRVDHRQRKYYDWLATQAEPVEGLAGADATFERGTHEIGAQAAFDVGSGSDAQQVQGHELGGIAEGLGAFVAQRLGDRSPDRAEDLVAGFEPPPQPAAW